MTANQTKVVLSELLTISFNLWILTPKLLLVISIRQAAAAYLRHTRRQSLAPSYVECTSLVEYELIRDASSSLTSPLRSRAWKSNDCSPKRKQSGALMNAGSPWNSYKARPKSRGLTTLEEGSARNGVAAATTSAKETIRLLRCLEEGDAPPLKPRVVPQDAVIADGGNNGVGQLNPGARIQKSEYR
jgi:hypothetical protein